MNKIDLNGSWTLSAKSVFINKKVSNDTTFEFTVPGEVYSALEKQGVINNPYIGMNALEDSWIKKSDWRIAKKFNLEKKRMHYILRLKRISSKAILFVNKKNVQILDKPDMAQLVDITSYLNNGENEIILDFLESDKTRDKSNDRPVNPLPPLAPNITPIGIFNSVTLFETDSFYPIQTYVSSHFNGSKWSINIGIELFSYVKKDSLLIIDSALSKVEEKVSLKEGFNLISYNIDLDSSKLEEWNPIGYGKEHLYPISVELESYKTERMIGFRRINIEEDPLKVFINDKAIFIKGTNFLGLDSLPSRIKDIGYENCLEKVIDMNLNYINVGTPHFFEKNFFFSESSRLGLLLNVEIPTYFDDEIIKYQIKRLKGFPSIIFWSLKGNENTTKERFEEVSTIIKNIDSTRSVLLPNSSFPHYSFPSFFSLGETERFINCEKINITGPEMEYHQAEPEIAEKVFSFLAKYFLFPKTLENIIYLSEVSQAIYIENAIINNRLSKVSNGFTFNYLKSLWPSSSHSILEYSGEKKLVSYASKRINSTLIPALLRVDDKLLIYVINDTGKDEEVEVKVKFRYFTGEKKETKYFGGISKKESITKLGEVNISQLDTTTTFCYLKLSCKDTVRERTILLDKPKKLKLEKPNISLEVSKIDNNKFNIKLKTDKPAFYVSLDQKTLNGTFSDNFIALRPSSEKNIIFTSFDNISEVELRSNLRIYNLYASCI